VHLFLIHDLVPPVGQGSVKMQNSAMDAGGLWGLKAR
jgi:hypothetical protein